MPTVPLPSPARSPQPRLVTVDVDGTAMDLAVCEVGLACCALEAGAALAAAPGGEAAAGERHTVLVVAGTVTDRMAPLVEAMYAALPEPRHVVSFGVCSNTGGPYWDSYSVTKGVERVVPVDVHVPGCPPRPEALVDGLRLLAKGIRGEAS